jgi:hypothetical protein
MRPAAQTWGEALFSCLKTSPSRSERRATGANNAQGDLGLAQLHSKGAIKKLKLGIYLEFGCQAERVDHFADLPAEESRRLIKSAINDRHTAPS